MLSHVVVLVQYSGPELITEIAMKITWKTKAAPIAVNTFVHGYVGTRRCFVYSFFPLLVRQGSKNPYALVCFLPDIHRGKRHFGSVEEVEAKASELLAEWLEGFIKEE